MLANTNRFVTLSEMIKDYLIHKPAASEAEIFDAFAFLAGIDTRLEGFNQDTQTLCYRHNHKLRFVKRSSFTRQFRRVRDRINKVRTSR